MQTTNFRVFKNHMSKIVVFLLLTMVGLALPPWTRPANAAGPTLSVSMSVVTSQPVLSGNPVTWEISWQCSSVEAVPCTGARIDVTKPAFTTSNGSAVGAPGFTTAAFVDSSGAHYIFINPLPAGSSGTLQLLWESLNTYTPDGTVLTPVATFSATNASSLEADGNSIRATGMSASTVELNQDQSVLCAREAMMVDFMRRLVGYSPPDVQDPIRA